MSLHYLGKHEPLKLCLFSHAGRQRSRRSGAMSRNFALLGAIVLQVDWRRYSEHLFVPEKDEVDSMFRELLKQQLQCRLQDTVYSMTEKQFPGFMLPQVVQRGLGEVG